MCINACMYQTHKSLVLLVVHFGSSHLLLQSSFLLASYRNKNVQKIVKDLDSYRDKNVQKIFKDWQLWN